MPVRVTLRAKEDTNFRADETGRAGDENFLGHVAIVLPEARRALKLSSQPPALKRGRQPADSFLEIVCVACP